MMKKWFVWVTVLLILTLAGCRQDYCATETTAPAQTAAPVQTTTAPVQTAAPVQTTTAETEPRLFPEGTQLEVYALRAPSLQDSMLNTFIEEATGLNILWKTDICGCLHQFATESDLPVIRWWEGLGAFGGEDFVNLWDYQELMPNFFAHFNSPEYADYKAAYMRREGELYCAPVLLNGDVHRCGWIYREDIFQELKLEVPTDWDSFYACLKTLKTAYPDSYPFIMHNNMGWVGGNKSGLTEFAQQFGVNYCDDTFALDSEAGKFYDPYTTDAMRELLKKLKLLLEEGLIIIENTNADPALALAGERSFITHNEAYLLGTMEAACRQTTPDASLNWFNNIPMAESDLPYQTRETGVTQYCWAVQKGEDVEVALRYLDWLYSEEGAEILSWGVEGKSFGVDADEKKYFLEGYDTTYQASFREAGYIDFDATLAGYDEKTQDMILGTMAAAAEGGFRSAPKLSFLKEDREVIYNYEQNWLYTRNIWLEDFLSGEKDIHDDTQWQAYKDAIAEQHIEELLSAYNSAYTRYLQEREK